ncbi:polyketide synthase dehydratase domain-containing protein [Amycolatopsis minnesotensis]|uniref:Polyketide synthase dehydratase domain-containing protein n=1 Tax=Amycolatopsis minnesotensis TaxID=337894 RepID=A0ABN2QR03_9PSEU
MTNHVESPDAEVMPRPPRIPLPGPAGAGERTQAHPVAACHHDVTTLHTRYLELQREIVALLSQHGATPPVEDNVPTATETILDPAAEPWLADHSPLWTIPVLPITCVAEQLARAAGQHPVRVLRDIQMRRWLPVPGPTPIRLTCDGPAVGIEVWWEAATPGMSRYATVATGTVGETPSPRPARFAPLTDAEPLPDPYSTAEVFHGPSFQYLTSARIGSVGATATLDAFRGTVPHGLLHPGLLDSALHVITPATLRRWMPERTTDSFAFPHRITALEFHDHLPHAGTIDAEARFAGADSTDPRLFSLDLQLCSDDTVLVAFHVVLITLPAGPFADVPGLTRRAYLRDREFVPSLLLSTQEGTSTVVHRDAIEPFDRMPGAATSIYALGQGDTLPQIAAKEHLARLIRAHPSRITVDNDLRHARCDGRAWPISVTHDHDHARVHDRN